MLAKAADTAAKLRAAGGKVLHTPITFKADGSDNPNKGLGILAGCAKDSLFTEGTWNAGERNRRPCLVGRVQLAAARLTRGVVCRSCAQTFALR